MTQSLDTCKMQIPNVEGGLGISSHSSSQRRQKSDCYKKYKEQGEHLIFPQGYSEALVMVSVGSYSAKAVDQSIWGFTHISPVPFFPKDATHSTAALVYIILLTV